MIRIEHLEKRYSPPGGDSPIVLGFDSLTIAPSQQVAVAGPSGSGKTTLLSMIGGFVEPSSGGVTWNGLPWPGKPGALSARARARRVGFVFQELNLLPSLSLFENLEAAGRFLGLPEADPVIRRALERVGLAKRLRHKPDQLSRGERQRAAVARAALYPHELILADEPTASLDRTNADLVMDFLIGMALDNGSALLVATHDPLVMEKLPCRFDLPARRIAVGSARRKGTLPGP